MADPSKYGLSQKDKENFQQLLQDRRQRVHSTSNRPRVTTEMISQGDSYVALTPVGGIPARSGTTLGSAVCQIYRVRRIPGSDPELVEVVGTNRTVCNLSLESVEGGEYVQVSRDRWGVWLVSSSSVGQGSDGGLCSNTSAAHSVRVYRNDPIEIAASTVFLPHGVFGFVEWQGTRWDTHGWFNPNEPEVLTIQVTGWYIVGGHFRFEGLEEGDTSEWVGSSVLLYEADDTQLPHAIYGAGDSPGTITSVDNNTVGLYYLTAGQRVKAFYTNMNLNPVTIPASDGRSCELWLIRVDRDISQFGGASISVGEAGTGTGTSGTVPLVQDVETLVGFDASRFDTLGIWNGSSRFTIAVPGKYLIGGCAAFDLGYDVGSVKVLFRKNGSEWIGASQGSKGLLDFASASGATLENFEVGDYVEMYVWAKNEGGTAGTAGNPELVVAGQYSPEFWICLIDSCGCCEKRASAYAGHVSETGGSLILEPVIDTDNNTLVWATEDLESTSFTVQKSGYYLLGGYVTISRGTISPIPVDIQIFADDGVDPFPISSQSARTYSTAPGIAWPPGTTVSIGSMNAIGFVWLEVGWKVSLWAVGTVVAYDPTFKQGPKLWMIRLDGGERHYDSIPASVVTYEPADVNDWIGTNPPEWADEAFDELADRVSDLEAGGPSNHAALSNLPWIDSGHTGTINRLGGFGASGEAIYYDPNDFAGAVHNHVVTDIIDFPSLAAVAITGDYNDLLNLPSLATVATTGDFDDLSNKPTIESLLSGLSPAAGDMLYFNGSSWALVPAGSEGDVLTMVSGVPTWQSP